MMRAWEASRGGLATNKVLLEELYRPVAPDALRTPGSCKTTGSQQQARASLALKAVPSISQNLSSESSHEGHSHDQALRERLDFSPTLNAADITACLLVPAMICALLYYGVRPSKFSPLYAIGMGMIYAAWVAIMRAVLLERHYTGRLVSGEDLGDANSRFPSIEGLKVHAKVFKPATGPIQAMMHCYHGFGANVESWDSVQRKLAEKASILVSSHDKPGFGLTERPVDPAKYSSQFNGTIGQQILASEAEALKHGSQASQSKLKKILVGHSMGGSSAAAVAIKHPEEIDGLILVAPAVMVMGFVVRQQSGRSGTFAAEGQSRTLTFDAEAPPLAALERPAQKNRARRLAFAVTTAILAKCSRFFKVLLAPFTVVSLRAAVRSRAFWERGLGRAWFDKAKLTPKVVDAYRKPQLVKGWERGLVEFTSSRLAGNASLWQVVKDAWIGKTKPLQAEDLAAVVAKHNIKVLIVHGKYDRIVPASNSRRLAALIPSAKLLEWDRCGHLPHEEHPEDFIKITNDFVDSLRHPRS